MNFPIYMGRTSLFQILGVLGSIIHLLANSGDPDQTPRSAASDLCLCCLPMPHKKNARLIWVKVNLLSSILATHVQRYWSHPGTVFASGQITCPQATDEFLVLQKSAAAEPMKIKCSKSSNTFRSMEAY